MAIPRYVLTVIILVGLLPQGAPVAGQDHAAIKADPISMVIFPRRNVKITYGLFSPMAEYLSRSLGRKVALKTPRDFQAFAKVLESGEFDLVHLNQYHYIVANEKYGHKAILKNVEFGSSTMSGAIMVRNDSGIETIEDLRGKKILFGGDTTAMQSYIIPSWLLHKAGLQKDEYTEMFANNPPNALISTYHRQADAAGVGNAVLRINVVKNSIDVEQMKTLIEGPSLPHLVWAVNKDMPTELAEQIQEKLSMLVNHPAGQLVLDKAQLTSLAVVTDSEYDPYRSILAEIQSKIRAKEGVQ